MITVVNAENQSLYRDLFIDASNLLLGYEAIRVFDKEVTEYFYKPDPDKFIFEACSPAITSQGAFENALKLNNGELFKKAYYQDTPDKEVDPVELGFLSEGQTGADTLGITTLEEYFSWLFQIKKIGEKYVQKYTVLPLDEPHFEINANTRAIIIPADFKKNGIAVQGDDLAEVVYFKVDRYYDAVDLNACDIYVQWELPKDKIKGVSPVQIKDINSQPGKLIFGWPISSAITKSSGSLKFSVQFYQLGGDENKSVTYSLNTLVASVNIQSSIGLDISDTSSYSVDEVGSRLNDRIQASIIAGGALAAEPEFFEDLELAAGGTWDLAGDPAIYNLQAWAGASDAGGLEYIWKFVETDDDSAEQLNNRGTITEGVTEEYIEVDVADMIPGRVYYTKTGNRYDRYTTPIPVTDADALLKTYYKKVSQCVATKAGSYYVIAENRITNNSNVKESKHANFKKPTMPTNLTVTASNEHLIQDGKCNLAVTATYVNPEVQTYQWQMDANYSANAALNYTDIDGATGAAYEATVPGHYRVVVTNTRNLVEKQVVSEKQRITNPAATPVLEPFTSKDFDVTTLSDENCLVVEMDDSVESDRYIVEWHVYQEKDCGVVETVTLNPGVTIHKFNPANEVHAAKIKELTGEDNIVANYYPVVTNEVNGSKATSSAFEQPDMYNVYDPAAISPEALLPEEEEEETNKPVTLNLSSEED